MPATSPRLCITINDEAHGALKRLASIQGRPLASVIRELLEDAAPTVDQIATSIAALKAAEASARAGIAGTLAEVADELQPHLTGILGHFRAIGELASVEGVEVRADAASGSEARSDRAPAAATPV